VVQAFINSLVGWVVFKFLTEADIGYLDLTNPRTKKILCVAGWPLRYESSGWFSQDAWTTWTEMAIDQRLYVKENECVVTEAQGGQRGVCDKVRFPASDLSNNLGFPLSKDTTSTGDLISIGSTWFLYLGLSLWFTMTVHELALTSVRNHNDVLDLIGVRQKFPKFIKFSGWVMGYTPFKKMRNCGKAVKILAWILLPVFIVWGIAAFSFIWCPVALVLYIFHPISLSRGAVFVFACLFVLYGLAMTICGIIFIADEDTRPMYAVTWQTQATKNEKFCSCGCTYHISMSASQTFTLIGLSAVWKAFIIGFRCLKGLRRSNWANLLTVMFPVPLNIYPVEWKDKDGRPIQHRTGDDPVQGELAFDPFALMDEQPDSAETILVVKPTPKKDMHHVAHEVEGPAATTTSKLGKELHVGCCGFPYFGHVESKEPEEPVTEERSR